MTPLSCLSIVALLLGLAAPAHAYLDPGTGSILLQGLIAAIASVGFYAKTHWHAIKARFSKQPPEADDDETADEATDQRD